MASSNICSEGDVIIWQGEDATGLNTEAIQVNGYDEGVSLIQDGHVVNVAFETFETLFKVMRGFKKSKK